MENCIALLKSHNIKVTHQRIGVCKVIFDSDSHYSAEEIFDKVKIEIPTISLATVYSILDFFKEKRLISEIKIKFDRSCYERRLDLHHHFLCKKCGKILDLNIKPCHALETGSVEGHSIEDLKGYFYGICKDCK